jgi:hypothetical protein
VVTRIKMNLGWALGYNVVCIPFAAGLLFPLIHCTLPPQMAGLAMAMSSVSVVCSSLSLQWYRKPVLCRRFDEEQRHLHLAGGGGGTVSKSAQTRRSSWWLWSLGSGSSAASYDPVPTLQHVADGLELSSV